MFRVVDVFDVAENFVRIDRVSFFSVGVVVVRAFVFCAFAQRDGGHGCGGFDEGIGVVQLRRRLHRVSLERVFPIKKLLLFIREKMGKCICTYSSKEIRRREIRKRERTHVELVWSSVGVACHKQRAARFEKEK